MGLLQTLFNIYTQPNPSYVLGIDTSHWTGIVNWQVAKEAGIKFAIIKFMDGKVRTRYAAENYKGAKDAGILVGSYQWLRKVTEYSPGGQAREYIAMLKDYPVDIRPAVDYEWSPAGSLYNVDASDLYGFVVPFEAEYGAKPMIYSAYGYLMDHPLPASYSTFPFWQARYGAAPLACKPWNLDWKFWQFTETGEGLKYGVNPNFERAVDLNYWVGSLEDLNKFCGKVTEPPPLAVDSITVHIRSDKAEKLWVKVNDWDATEITTLEVEPYPVYNPPAIKYGRLKFQVIDNELTQAGKTTPAVVQLQDRPIADSKKGQQIPVLSNAWAHIDSMNDDAGKKYARSVHKMWINTDYTDDPKAESIGCMFNVVSWSEEKNSCAKLSCYQHDQQTFDGNWYSRPDLHFKAQAVNIDGSRQENVGVDIDCYIPLMARSTKAGGTGELWLALDEIEEFPKLPVEVTTNYGLNIRKEPAGPIVGSLPSWAKVTVLEYKPLGANVWGRTDRGWIALEYGNVAMTSWRLQTRGVIP